MQTALLCKLFATLTHVHARAHLGCAKVTRYKAEHPRRGVRAKVSPLHIVDVHVRATFDFKKATLSLFCESKLVAKSLTNELILILLLAV